MTIPAGGTVNGETQNRRGADPYGMAHLHGTRSAQTGRRGGLTLKKKYPRERGHDAQTIYRFRR